MNYDKLNAYKLTTRYLVMIDLGGRHGISSGDIRDTFDDACDGYDFHMDEGNACTVHAIDFAAGITQDVTAEANALIAKRCNDSAVDLPEWLEDAL